MADSVGLPIEYEGADELLARVEQLEKQIAATGTAAKKASDETRKASESEEAAVRRVSEALKAAGQQAKDTAAAARKWREDNVARERDRINAEYNARLKQTEQATDALNKKLTGEFAANQIGKLADAFEGTTKKVIEATASVTQGFAQGGVIPAALSAVNALIIEGVNEWKKWRDAERAAHLSAIENVEKLQAAFEASSTAVEAAIAARKQAVSLIEAQNFAQRVGIGLDEAKLLLERQSLREQIAGEQAKLDAKRAAAGITDRAGDSPELAAKQREIDALAALERQREAEQDASANARRLAREAKAAADAKAAREKSQAEWLEAQKLRQKQWEDEQKVRDEQARRHTELQDKREREIERRQAEAAERAAAQAAANRVSAERRAVEEAAEARATAAEKRREDLLAQADLEERVAKEAEALENRKIDAALASGEALARLALEFADSESQKTQAQYEEAAKRAAIEAAMQGALAFANYALGRPDQAIAAGIAAAQYAAIAAGSLVASAAAPAESPAARSSSARDAGGSSTGAASRGFGRSGGGERQPVTIVMGSGGVLLTASDVQRNVRRALAEAERTR